jgi:2',3'-cyclic-nucleotide 2'-phosphodiesterase (5'-nucleotidase family)
MGGFARRASLFDSTRAVGRPTLAVDAGNFSPRRGPERWERASFIFENMARLEYDAVTPGDLELFFGPERLRGLYAEHPEVRVVSANLRDAWGGAVFPEYAVIEKEGVRFGVTGVTRPSYYEEAVAVDPDTEEGFTFEDPQTALERVIPELQRKSDLVVVLFHDNLSEVLRQSSIIDGIDVAVAGHNPGYSSRPDSVGAGAWVIRPGGRGQYVYVAEIALNIPLEEVTSFTAEAIQLDEAVPIDAAVDSLITGWELDLKERTTRR